MRQRVLAAARESSGHHAVLYLDLDLFKSVNDGIGYVSSDAVLQEIAQRLTACVRDADTVARVGGDEFVVLLPEIIRAEDASTALLTDRCDIVVLDLGLPDADGLAVLAEMRRRGDATPVLILTARGSLKDRVTGLQSGADLVLIGLGQRISVPAHGERPVQHVVG